MQVGIVQIVMIAIVATLLIAVLKPHRPEMAIMVGIAAGVIILGTTARYLEEVLELIRQISGRINLDTSYIAIVFKIIAVAYLCEFGAQVCKDAGETGISAKVELAGKVLIVYLSSPIMLSLLNLLIGMI